MKIYIDANQGDADGGAFGYVGANSKEDEYQGWFFDWPGEEATVWTVKEREGVINSLKPAGEPGRPLPYEKAYQRLKRYLLKFDCRRTKASVEKHTQRKWVD